MKNKTINSKIEALSNYLKAIKSKAENAEYLKDSGVFQTLESNLEAIIVLQKDVDTLKETLKAKTQELEEGIKKLKKAGKDAKKILKKEKKPAKPSSDKIQKEQPSASKLPESKNKKAKSERKTTKNKK